jgi:hypothetical protein
MYYSELKYYCAMIRFPQPHFESRVQTEENYAKAGVA